MQNQSPAPPPPPTLLTAATATATATVASFRANMEDDEHLVIDFQRLYQEEKRKMKEERLLRRIEQHLLPKYVPSPSKDNHKDHHDHDNDRNHNTHPTKTTYVDDGPNHWTWEHASTSTPLWLPPNTTTSTSTPYTIPTLVPNMIHYTKDFIVNASYRDALLQWLYQLPENNSSSSSLTSSSITTIDTATAAANGKWTVLPHAQRRVALFDANIQQQQLPSKNAVNTVQSKFPPPLQILIDTLIQAGVYNQNDGGPTSYLPNHILINEYVHAHQGILPHTDGPAYHPKTITISFGIGDVLLHFTPIMPQSNHHRDNHHHPHQQEFQMVLHGNGSLIIFENEAYSNYYHSIHDLSSTKTTTSEFNRNLDSEKNDESPAIVEWTGPNCYNAESGTCVVRQPNRISISIRHKFV